MGFWIQTIIRFKGSEEQFDTLRKTLTGKTKAETPLKDAEEPNENSVIGQIRNEFFGKATSIFLPKTKEGFQDIVIYTRCTWVPKGFYDFLSNKFPEIPYKLLVDETDLVGEYEECSRKTNDEKMEFFEKDDLEIRSFDEICEGREIPLRETIVGSLKTKYTNCEVCMAEMLAQEQVPAGLTFEDAFEAYVKLMKWSDGDKFYVKKENETIKL